MDADDLAAAMESRFTENGWPSQWRDAIYDFHHFHSLGHEVLGIARGHAQLALGGEGGAEIEVSKGDVLLLPPERAIAASMAARIFLSSVLIRLARPGIFSARP